MTATSSDFDITATMTWRFQAESTSTTKGDSVPTNYIPAVRRTDCGDEVKRREADVYLINIGGNDITPTSEPDDIFMRIVNLVYELYRRRRVKMVYVAEIQTRGDFRGGLTKEEFDRQRQIMNELLKERFQQYFVSFTDVRYPNDYDEDLVHLDTSERLRRNSGMRKYANRIRRIFCSYRACRY